MILLNEARSNASISLAASIRDGEDQFEEDVRKLAAAATLPAQDDQLSVTGPWLNRNSVIVMGTWFALEVASNAVGAGQSAITTFLSNNAELILAQAPAWGEPFVAWITPILARAQEAYASARHLLK